MSERDSVYPVKGIKYIKSLYKSSVPEPLIQGSFNVFGLGWSCNTQSFYLINYKEMWAFLVASNSVGAEGKFEPVP